MERLVCPRKEEIEWSTKRPFGTSVSNEPLSMPLEQVLSMSRFENRGKLEDLRWEILPNPHQP